MCPVYVYHVYINKLQQCGLRRCKIEMCVCSELRGRCSGAEPVLSSWNGREGHGTGLWTGTVGVQTQTHTRTHAGMQAQMQHAAHNIMR